MLRTAAATLALAGSALAGVPPMPTSEWSDAGYIDVNDGADSYFYWVSESRNDPANDPVALWLTGGPGCSSMIAFFMENGPVTVNDDLELETNPFSWNNNATVVWLDQPAGAGFSYGDMAKDEDDVAANVLDFMTQFFDKYSDQAFASAPAFHVVGESYGGHYVPAVADALFGNLPMPLTSFAVGNGLSDVGLQFPAYITMAEENDLLSSEAIALMNKTIDTCVSGADRCNEVSGPAQNLLCLEAYMKCSLTQLTPFEFQPYCIYDYTLDPPASLPMCYDMSNFEDYLAQDDVKEALGVTDHRFSECNKATDLALSFRGDWTKSTKPHIESLLANGVDYVNYAGVLDIICNYEGQKLLVGALEWDGADDFASADYTNWGDEAGRVKTATTSDGTTVTLVEVNGAGHMVPMDQPENALYLFNQLVLGGQPL